jgi:hypothetical protein
VTSVVMVLVANYLCDGKALTQPGILGNHDIFYLRMRLMRCVRLMTGTPTGQTPVTLWQSLELRRVLVAAEVVGIDHPSVSFVRSPFGSFGRLLLIKGAAWDKSFISPLTQV